jgi:hypothetical protein
MEGEWGWGLGVWGWEWGARGGGAHVREEGLAGAFRAEEQQRSRVGQALVQLRAAERQNGELADRLADLGAGTGGARRVVQLVFPCASLRDWPPAPQVRLPL